MKLSELCELITGSNIVLFDKSINKVRSLSRADAPEVVAEFYGERTVEGIIATDFMEIAITIL